MFPLLAISCAYLSLFSAFNFAPPAQCRRLPPPMQAPSLSVCSPCVLPLLSSPLLLSCTTHSCRSFIRLSTQDLPSRSCTGRPKVHSPSRPIPQRHPRTLPTLPLPIHPIPHLVHPRPILRRIPTRNSLPLHRTPTLGQRILPLRLPQGTRRHRLHHLQQLGHESQSKRCGK